MYFISSYMLNPPILLIIHYHALRPLCLLNTQLSPCQPHHRQTTNIPRPPQQTPNLTRHVPLNSNLRNRIPQPRNRIQRHQSIQLPSINSRMQSQKHTPNKKRIILNRIIMRESPALDHIERLLRDLPLAHHCRAIFLDVFAWRGVVVELVVLFWGARREEEVCGDKVCY